MWQLPLLICWACFCCYLAWNSVEFLEAIDFFRAWGFFFIWERILQQQTTFCYSAVSGPVTYRLGMGVRSLGTTPCCPQRTLCLPTRSMTRRQTRPTRTLRSVEPDQGPCHLVGSQIKGNKKQVCFHQTHHQGLRRLFLMVCLGTCAVCTHPAWHVCRSSNHAIIPHRQSCLDP